MSSMVYFLQNDLEKRQVMGMLRRLSYEDALTGLYNRVVPDALEDDVTRRMEQLQLGMADAQIEISRG